PFVISMLSYFFFFLFPVTAPPLIYTLSLHDALPICCRRGSGQTSTHPPSASSFRLREPGLAPVALRRPPFPRCSRREHEPGKRPDRKSTRLNSSHQIISYAVFCLKKKKTHHMSIQYP